MVSTNGATIQNNTGVEDTCTSAELAINDIKIYDNVYSTETCTLLHQLAKEHSDVMGDDSSIFYRKNHLQKYTKSTKKSKDDIHQRYGHDHHPIRMTPLEFAIDSILTNICNDTTTNIVEYWSRQDYMNMDVHCDIDEKLLEMNKRFLRYPEFAHILYLTIQLPRSMSTAPTCIFPTKLGGWKKVTTNATLLNSTTNTTGYPDKYQSSVVDLVIVPAVSGRVVRFPGAMMHAVPKPSHQWLEASAINVNRPYNNDSDRDASANDETDSDADDDDNDDSDDTNPAEVLRSVVLFNCWPNDRPPPMGLQPYQWNSDDNIRPPTNVPDGIIIDDEDEKDNDLAHDTFNNDSLQRPVPSILLNDDYKSTIVINEHWVTTPIQNMDHAKVSALTNTSATSKFLVRLMGNKYRRRYPTAVARLDIHPNNTAVLSQALAEPITPTWIPFLFQCHDE
jgi:hypothetical protein